LEGKDLIGLVLKIKMGYLKTMDTRIILNSQAAVIVKGQALTRAVLNQKKKKKVVGQAISE
jgi:hypothetical protein